MLNQELLGFYQNLSEKVPCYIFTTLYIQEYPPCKEKIQKYFQKIFIADQLKIKKSTSEAYLKITQLLELNPEEIFFIDDTEKNIKAAKIAGIKTILHKNNPKTFQKVMEILGS